MPNVATAPAPFAVRVPRVRRDTDLLRLARELEPAQPGHALELRGMALHESCAASRTPATVDAWWRRAARAAWSAVAAYGEGRARREILQLAERWETSQPQVARELRAAASR